ncbi:MFS transporter [Oceanobacter mangrovi]|uniref:MFS transporter n=1 Tax=Oceanobacter mangrovi TaxID=2862510 RepID=UPI001C8E4723|nr:MFS transporter [Oceanobacter mangrovi]
MPIERRTLTSLLIAGTLFMEILDANVITTALPAIAADFHVPPAWLSVGVSAYLIALTVFIPISGWAADRFGNRRVFCSAIGVFLAASLLCAASTSLMEFTLARILQGIGGSLMVPVGRLVVLRNTPKDQLVRTMAILTWPALVAPLIGPVLGGWIATHWSWHWIFLLNIPLGLLAFAAAWRLIPIKGEPVQSFDYKGFLLVGSGIGLLMAGVELCSREDLSLWYAATLILAGLAVLWLTSRYLQQAAKPLFRLDPLSVGTFRATTIGGSMFRICIATAPFLLPLMFQIGFGYSPVQAGSLLLWLFAGNLAIKPATTWIMNRFGFRAILLGNGLMLATGFLTIAQFTAETPLWLVGLVLFISGANRSMQFTTLGALSYADVPQRQMRDANTLQAIVVQMNMGAGIAFAALMLSIACLLDGRSAAAPLAEDFQHAFYLIAVMLVPALWYSARLPSDIGSAVLKHRPA